MIALVVSVLYDVVRGIALGAAVTGLLLLAALWVLEPSREVRR